MKNFLKSLGIATLAILGTATVVQAVQISVPSATQFGQTLIGKGTGNYIASSSVPANTVASAGGQVLYDKSYWQDLNDFTASGTVPTLVNGSIEMNPASPGTWDASALQFLNVATTTNENIDFEITFKVVGTPNSSSFGLGLGRRSINPWYTKSVSVNVDMSGTTDTMKLWPDGNGATTTPIGTKTTGFHVAANDVIKLIYSQRGQTIITSLFDVTKSDYVTFTNTETIGATRNFETANSSKFKLFDLGGTYDIQHIKIVSRQTPSPRTIIVGDSKSVGLSSGYIDLRFGNELNQIGPVEVFAGTGDRTVEALDSISSVIAMKPQYVILNIGRNDLASGVLTATWQANYASIVSQLKSAGITVIHLLPIPETSQADQSALTTYINTTYPSDTRIDVSDNWVNGTDLSTDNVHPNAVGHQLIAQHIIASSTIATTTQNQIIVDSPLTSFPFQETNALPNQWQSAGANIYFNTGNIGVGTTSPNRPLSFELNVNNATSPSISVQNYNAGGSAEGQIDFFNNRGNTPGTNGAEVFLGSSGWAAPYTDAFGVWSAQTGPIVFGTSNAERFRIDTNGFLGIGNTAPLHNLDSSLSLAGGYTNNYSAINTGAGEGTSPCYGFSYSKTATFQPASVCGTYRSTNNRNGAGIEFLTGGGNINASATGTVKAVLTGYGFFGIGTTSPWAQLSIATTTTNTWPLMDVSHAAGVDDFFISSTGIVSIGTTTPTANLQVTTTSANATTSVQFGKANQSKGTCLTIAYDTAGSPVYEYFAAGATTPTYQNGGTPPSGCQN